MTRQIPQTDGDPNTIYEDLEDHERTGFNANENEAEVNSRSANHAFADNMNQDNNEVANSQKQIASQETTGVMDPT